MVRFKKRSGWVRRSGHSSNTLLSGNNSRSLGEAMRWALGVGRVGSILGPTIGGALLGLGWSADALLLAAVIPAAVASVAVVALRYA